MADSSGNAKLVIGAVAGAVVATGIVLALGGRPGPTPADAPAAKAPAPASQLPAVAPQAPPAAPAPKPASETADWRGKIEVGQTVTPTPRPHSVPRTASEIAEFLQEIAKRHGGDKALGRIVNARYSVELDGRPIQLDVHGVDGVLLRDPARWVDAVWRPSGCVERRNTVQGPCQDDVVDQARTAYVAHALTVVAPATGTLMKPVRVESGMHEANAWTSLAFTLTGTKARITAFFNTNTMKLRYGALAWRPQDQKLKTKDAPDDKSLLPGVVVDGHMRFDGWRAFRDGIRLPATWCQLGGEQGPDLGGSKGADVACRGVFTVRSVRPSDPNSRLAMPPKPPKIWAQAGSMHRLAMAAPASGAALVESIKGLDEKVGEAHFSSSLGGVFVVRGAVVAFGQEVMSAYPGEVLHLLARPRVAVGSTRMKLTELVAGVAAFEKRVIAAGFTPIKGHRLAFPDTRKKPDPSAELDMIVEVPIAP